MTPGWLNVVGFIASADCGGDDPIVFKMGADVGVAFTKDATLIKAITVFKKKLIVKLVI